MASSFMAASEPGGSNPNDVLSDYENPLELIGDTYLGPFHEDRIIDDYYNTLVSPLAYSGRPGLPLHLAPSEGVLQRPPPNWAAWVNHYRNQRIFTMHWERARIDQLMLASINDDSDLFSVDIDLIRALCSYWSPDLNCFVFCFWHNGDHPDGCCWVDGAFPLWPEN